MNVAFVLRRDAYSKAGGDSGKVLRYKQNLKDNGVNAHIFCGFQDFLKSEYLPDIVHIFNLQTPYENIQIVNWCLKQNIPYVVSTIHHQREWMEKYFATVRFPFLSKLIGFELFDWLNALAKEILIYKSLKNISSFLLAPSHINKRILENAKVILPLSKTELKNIESDFSNVNLPAAVILNNALTYLSIENDVTIESKRYGVIVVGRIEPRKNQLKIANALKNSQFDVTFIGKKNMSYQKYIDDFDTILSENDNLHYVGAKSQEELKNFYLNAKLCLSNSWFEVVSQVDLEALVCGCNIVVSLASAIDDYFSEIKKPISLSPLCSESEILAAVDAAYNSSLPILLNDSLKSWADISQELNLIYHEVLANKINP